MIKISFTQANMRDRAAIILGIPRNKVLNVCSTCGGKMFMVLHKVDWRDTVSTVTVWQMVEAKPLEEHQVTGHMELYPDSIFASLVLLGLDLLPDEKKLKTAYRKASKIAHPDMGGSAEEFAAVNASYSQVMAFLASRSARPI